MKYVKWVAITWLLSCWCFADEIPEYHAVAVDENRYIGYEDYRAPNQPVGKQVFLLGCSWYCGGYVKNIESSSALEPNGKLIYAAKNAHDFDLETAWVEGVDGQGKGEYIDYHFNFDEMSGYSGSMGVTAIIIANGYRKTKNLWKANSRVKSLKMSVNGEPYAMLSLLDIYGLQTVGFGKVMFPIGKTTTIRFEIEEVYSGDKYSDLAISELVFEGVGVH